MTPTLHTIIVFMIGFTAGMIVSTIIVAVHIVHGTEDRAVRETEAARPMPRSPHIEYIAATQNEPLALDTRGGMWKWSDEAWQPFPPLPQDETDG